MRPPFTLLYVDAEFPEWDFRAMSMEDLEALIDRCASESRRSRDAEKRAYWTKLRNAAIRVHAERSGLGGPPSRQVS